MGRLMSATHALGEGDGAELVAAVSAARASGEGDGEALGRPV